MIKQHMIKQHIEEMMEIHDTFRGLDPIDVIKILVIEHLEEN